MCFRSVVDFADVSIIRRCAQVEHFLKDVIVADGNVFQWLKRVSLGVYHFSSPTVIPLNTFKGEVDPARRFRASPRE